MYVTKKNTQHVLLLTQEYFKHKLEVLICLMKIDKKTLQLTCEILIFDPFEPATTIALKLLYSDNER